MTSYQKLRRKAKLPLVDRLLLTLLYYRTYVTQEFVGFLFGVDKGTVCRVVQDISLCLAGLRATVQTLLQTIPHLRRIGRFIPFQVRHAVPQQVVDDPCEFVGRRRDRLRRTLGF